MGHGEQESTEAVIVTSATRTGAVVQGRSSAARSAPALDRGEDRVTIRLLGLAARADWGRVTSSGVKSQEAEVGGERGRRKRRACRPCSSVEGTRRTLQDGAPRCSERVG